MENAAKNFCKPLNTYDTILCQVVVNALNLDQYFHTESIEIAIISSTLFSRSRRKYNMVDD